MYKLSIYAHCRSSPFYIHRGERSDDGNIELALRIEIPPASTNGAAPHLSHHIIHISMRLFET